MQTIIFDFGNVIGYFDHERTLRRLAPFTDMTPAQMRAAVYDTSLEDAYEAGQVSTDDFLAEVERRWRLRCARAEAAAAIADIFHPNEAVCALIPRLKPRYRLLLGSNTNDLHSQQFRRQFADTLAHFDGLVMSHEIKVRKPQRGFFEHCSGLAKSPPERCVFIDDLPSNIAGARACGLHGIVFTDYRDLETRMRTLGISF
jgi:putative hydrolase of the HAD superfamily